MMTTRQRMLVFSSVLVFPLTLLIFHLLPNTLQPGRTFLLAMSLYWMYLGLCITLIMRGNFRSLRSLYKVPINLPLPCVIPFLPVFGAFWGAFLPCRCVSTPLHIAIILTSSFANGCLEELYWRGLYLIKFNHRALIGGILSPLLFTLWHISLWYLKGVVYHEGFWALVGGAGIMGVLWNYASRRTRSILPSSLAHILVNIFAFTGLFVQNTF